MLDIGDKVIINPNMVTINSFKGILTVVLISENGNFCNVQTANKEKTASVIIDMLIKIN